MGIKNMRGMKKLFLNRKIVAHHKSLKAGRNLSLA
jgi:hypothetical protein